MLLFFCHSISPLAGFSRPFKSFSHPAEFRKTMQPIPGSPGADCCDLTADWTNLPEEWNDLPEDRRNLLADWDDLPEDQTVLPEERDNLPEE
jgi:hypothetical protein